jgi:hydrogenase nickel incorporation protein HypA/HybF
MHEWALAEAVIAAAREAAYTRGLREISEVRISVGELQQIEEDILEFALSQLKKDKLAGARFRIVKARARFRCRICGHNWIFNRKELGQSVVEAIHFVPEIAHVYVKCPRCGSPDFEVLGGRGVCLLSVKGGK